MSRGNGLSDMGLFLVIGIFLVGASQIRADTNICDFSDLRGWKGLLADPEMRYGDLAAPVWRHGSYPSIRTDAMPHDWSAYSGLRFAMHSAKATGAGFMLLLYSENPKTAGDDYFSLGLRLDWEGWREFIIPFNELARSRDPVGFGKIDSIVFSAEGWGNTPNPESVVHIADIRLTHVAGPGISDEELFAILNLEHPGLERARAAVSSGDLSAARHELAEYFRQREKPVWKWDWRARPKHSSRPQGVDTREADRVLRRELLSVDVYHRFEDKIDWNLNPIDYREWPWQLNRHNFWVTLGRAYWATGEEKYAKEFVYQMRDWVRSCPVPRYSSGNATYTWRTIEAGIRAGQTWMEAYHLFLTSPSFGDDAILDMLKSFVEHARHLMRWPTGGNWLAMEANGLIHVGVMFPEFKEAAEWRRVAIERLYAELDRQVYPDGAQIELSTGYHQVSLSNFVMAWDIAHLNAVAMPSDYIAKVQRMYDYNMNASMPDGTLPGLNDANRLSIRGSMRQALRFFSERKDYEWLATEGKSGEPPKVGSIALPFSGQLIMRTGWRPDDLYMLLDFGPFGYGHQHEDALSFVLYAHGRYHIVDAGNYAYDNSKWRRYVLSTRAHNTIMVDGLEQHRAGKPREQYVVSKPLPNRWATGKGLDYAAGTYDQGYGPDNGVKIIHTRHVFFVKPEYWIMTDFLNPEDAGVHGYESIIHLDGDNVTLDKSSMAVWTGNKDAANLKILPLVTQGLIAKLISGQEEPEVQGWMPSGPYKMRPLPTAIYELRAEGPANFLYILYPSPPGKECPIVGIRPFTVQAEKGIRPLGVTIRFSDGRVDHFVQAERKVSRLGFGDFETDAEAALVRVQNGHVSAFLAGGTFLKQAGKPIEAEAQPVMDLSQTDTVHRF